MGKSSPYLPSRGCGIWEGDTDAEIDCPNNSRGCYCRGGLCPGSNIVSGEADKQPDSFGDTHAIPLVGFVSFANGISDCGPADHDAAADDLNVHPDLRPKIYRHSHVCPWG
jgi:hypothetical protein